MMPSSQFLRMLGTTVYISQCKRPWINSTTNTASLLPVPPGGIIVRRVRILSPFAPVHYFDAIENGQMRLSGIGVIVDVLWHEIPHHSPLVKLGAFVVMPNHIHGILILTDPPVVDDGGARM
jgi:hypothetical protein